MLSTKFLFQLIREEDLNVPLNEETKFIVFKRCLWELFENCPICRAVCEIQHSTKGSLLNLTQSCSNRSCLYVRCWNSQPFVKNIPAGNILLSAAILFNGASYVKTLKVIIFVVVHLSLCSFRNKNTEFWLFHHHHHHHHHQFNVHRLPR